jgi:D-alanine-D-alanine ligase
MKLTVLFGGSSFEHEISIVSAITLKKVLRNESLDFIFIDAARDFYRIDAKDMTSKYFSSGAYKKSKKLLLKKGGFHLEGMLKSKKLETGVVLNLVHGRDGEDGKIASLLSFFDIPFIGPRTEASVISYNKLYTKLFAQTVGVETLPFEHLSKNDARTLQTPFPVIIKPARLGSSIGVSIVRSAKELDYALDVAFEFDDDVIVEPFIEGIEEYNLAGCKADEWIFSVVEAPQKEAFLDFEKKYMDFSRDERISRADIEATLEARLREAFKTVYDPLFAGALIRCDFFVKDDTVYLNEINPVPGSMANYLFDDFAGTLRRLSNALPRERTINVDYRYIHSIQKAKGKA